MNHKQTKREILRFFGQRFSYHLISLLCRSLRIEKINYASVENLKSSNKNYVLAFWHGTMILPWYLHGNPKTVALTSKSKDGDLLAGLLKKWNYKVVRGSSSSGGDIALRVMVDYAKNNYSIAITPDGPRGSRHIFKAGAVITAKKSNIPLVLAGIGFKKKKVLNNWDKFEIPRFFSKAKIVYSNPIFVDEALGYEQTSDIITQCENKLNELQLEAQTF